MNKNLQGRIFQFWKYTVSHGMALFRSPSDNLHNNNIDIYCIDIEYLEVSRFLGNINIEYPSDLDILRLSNITGKELTSDNILIMRNDSHSFAVVASGFHIEENNLDIFDAKF